MKLRQNGVSQKEAAAIFTDLGMSRKYGVSFEKKVNRANRKAMVLFPEEEDILHAPLLLYRQAENQHKSVILIVNNLFLKRGHNPLCFSRNNILRIREMKTGNRFPLNKRAVWSEVEQLDSS